MTGGASGIGKPFLGEGMKVVIADVEEKALKPALEELGDNAMGVVTANRRNKARFPPRSDEHPLCEVRGGGQDQIPGIPR